MSRISKAALLAFAVATLAGSCLHFVYALFPNGLTAVLAPVNESIWEHLKILVWPCVLGAVPLLRREPDGLGARAFSLLLAAGLMLAAGWLYHGVLDGRALLLTWCSTCCAWVCVSCCRPFSGGASGRKRRGSGVAWCSR